MRLADYFELAKNSLIHRKIRSYLTILGIVIGIAAVFSLISIGQGFDRSVTQQLSALGGDLIFVIPSSQSRGGPSFGFSQGVGAPSASQGELTTTDIAALKGIEGLAFVDGMIFDRAEVKFRGESVQTNVQGITADVIREFPIIKNEEGRSFSSAETRVAVVGHTVANNFFDRKIKIGDIIQIKGEGFRVIGILQLGSGVTASIFDQTITINFADAKRIFLDTGSKKVSAIIGKASENSDIDRVAKDVELRLRASHKIAASKKEDFTVTSSKTIQTQVGQISSTITIFLGGIAAIALLVGAIGVTNTMFMSVMERTRQIGILKALGAKNRDVMKIFLIESSLLGLVGGLIGVGIGIVIGLAIPIFTAGTGFDLAPAITPELILFSVLFSVGIGAVSGVLPARRAAKLEPVEALRYE